MKRHCGSAHRGQPAKVIKVDVDAKTSEPVLMSTSQKNEDIETEDDDERPNEDSQWYWRRHVQTSNNQMMSCRLCGYRQVGASALKRHINAIHLGFSPFACKYCRFATTEIRYARQHIEKMHPGFACKVIRRKYVSESEGEVHNEHAPSATAYGVTVGRAMSTSVAEPSSTPCDATASVTETDERNTIRKFDNVPIKTAPITSEPLLRAPPRQNRIYECIYCHFKSEDRFMIEIRNHIFEIHLDRYHFLCDHCRFGSMKRDDIIAHSLNKHPEKDTTKVQEDKTYARSITVLESHGDVRMVGVVSPDKVPLMELPNNARNDEQQLCSKPLVNGQATHCELLTKNVTLPDVVKTNPNESCKQTGISIDRGVAMNTRSSRNDKALTPTPKVPTPKNDIQGITSTPSSIQKPESDTQRSNSSTQKSRKHNMDTKKSTCSPTSTPKRDSDRLKSTSSTPKLPKADSGSQRSTCPSHSRPKRDSVKLRSNNSTPRSTKEDSDTHKSSSPSNLTSKRDNGRLRSTNSKPRSTNEDSDSQRRVSSASSEPKRGSDRLRSTNYTPRSTKDDSDSQRCSPTASSSPKVVSDIKGNTSRSCSIPKTVKREGIVHVKKKLKIKRHIADSDVDDIRGKEGDICKKALKSDVGDTYTDSAESAVSWKCKTCGLRLTKLAKMRRHVLTHHLNMRPYQCAVCDFADRKVKLVEEHIRRKHRKSRIHIPVLNMMDEKSDCLRKKIVMIESKTVNTKRLRASRKKGVRFNYSALRVTGKDGETLYRCDLCDHQVRVKGSIINHRKSHFKFHPFGCGYCDYKTSNRFFLVSHCNDVHAGRPVKSREISRSSSDEDKDELNEEKVASRKRGYLVSQAKPHADDKHGSDDDGDDGLMPTFMCQTCGKKMLLKSSMERHVMVEHLGYRPYRCSCCEYSAVNRSTVQTHIDKKHAGKPCDVVHKKDELLEARVHMNVVQVADTLDEPPLPTSFRCAVCKTYTTNSRSRISSHIADEVKYTPYQCSYCLFSSSRRDVVKAHVVDDHPGQKLLLKFSERMVLKQRVQDLVEQSVEKRESDEESDFDIFKFNGECYINPQPDRHRPSL